MGMFPGEGTLLPPQLNTQFTNPPAGPGHEWEIARWNQAVAQERAFNANGLRLDKYLREPLNNWWVSYDAGRLPVDQAPPKPPGEFWVGSDYWEGQWCGFTTVEVPEYPLCAYVEDDKGWTINGQFFKRQPKPKR